MDSSESIPCAQPQRTALVTGGSGALGSAIVRRLCRDGYAVAFTFNRNQAAADSLAGETGAAAFQADLTVQQQVQACVAAALKRLDHVDVLVNNAGLTQVMPFALLEEQDWDRVLAANLKTMFLVTHAVARGMITRQAGCIINIGSLAGHRVLEVPVHYAAAKAGVSGFTLALAKELSRYHIRVNCVVPGLLDAGVSTMVPEKEVAEYVRFSTAGRVGKPEEVAATVAFLASDEAGYINAQNIFVDGGV
ncbi:MAG: SDR family oxidoreductase [Planctomycetota bacterium]|nr:SDR family oxidoreductase [Planctomycetota bacterium]